jgi:tetratricopeptide (TPR) repeat protein
VAADYPGTDYAFVGQKGLVILYIKTNEDEKAQAAFDKLTADFAGHKGIAEAIWNIGINYNQAKKSDKAYEIHKYNVDNFPDDMYAMRSQTEIIFSYIRSANDAAADAAVKDLLNLFSKQPTLPAEIYQVARKYEEFKEYDKGSDLYQYDVENFPDDVHAMMSQTGIAKYYIREGNDAAADAAFYKLLTVFSKQPTLPEQIHYVARRYEDSKKYDKALELYQYNVDHFPNNVYTMWSQVRIVRSHIRDGNYAAADAAFNRLLTLFSDQPTLHREVYKIANKFSEAGNNQKGHQVYQYVIDRWSSDVDINSRKCVVMSYISLGRDGDAQTAIKNLMEQFKDHPDLSLVLWQTSEAYYNAAFKCENEGLDAKAKEYFAKVISLGETVRQQLSPSTTAAEAWFFSAECYYRLAQYEKAIEYYEKVVQNWPDYEYAWLAQHRVVKMYKWLLRAGVMSHSEAEAAMKIAYEQLLARYPDCPAAKSARNWLDQYHRENRGEQK